VIGFVVCMLLGAGFLASLYVFSRRDSRVEGSAVAVFKARQDLNALQGGLLPAEIVQRIFTKADFAYVAGEGRSELQKLFLAERKRIALLWAEHLLARVRNLREFHLGSARFYSRLSLRTEMRLAFQLVTLLWICRALQATIYLRGPYAAPNMVGRVAAAAASVCATSEEVMSFLRAGQTGSLGDESTRNLSAM
jgi:hypothetical protein